MPTTNTKPSRHALALPAALLPLLLLLIVAGAAAQPNDWRDDRSDDEDGRRMPPGARSRQPPPPSFSAPMVVLLVALIAVFFFIGFFSIYIRQCGRGSSGPAIPAAALLTLSRQEQEQQQRNGLDPALVASFPTMTYAEARALRVRDEGKGADMAVLECAVCLSEFDDDEELRLLPKCSHAFHPDCIGEWLAGHVTCPVCRCSLKPEEDKEDEPAAAAETNGAAEQQQQDHVAIDMNGEEEERRMEEATELDRIGSQRRAMRLSRSGRSISRAHSTGHSLSLSLSARRPRELDLERFTLRLPEQVRREMKAESMRRAAVARDDGSSRAARSARIARSDRWQQQSFIARTFSSSRVPFWGAAASRRAPPDAEAGAGGVLPAGSTTTMTPVVSVTTTGQGRAVREKTADGSVGSAKMGSVRFDCLGGGGAVAADDSENEAEEEKAIVRRV